MNINKNRYLSPFIAKDLERKMVFVGGPRQVGKTTLALTLLGYEKGSKPKSYLNWDIADHQMQIIKNELPTQFPRIVLDEVHKYAKWRGLAKGFYDQYYPEKQLLITGSARLDYYRKGGDSLLGRYHYYRLHPYSIMELNQSPSREQLNDLLEFGGFPEPLYVGTARGLRRWRNDRITRILDEDLRDLERVQEVSLLKILLAALPERVGSPLSLQSLREDLQVSHDSIRRWLAIFDNLYLTFRISPFGSKNIRAVKKEQKLYLWDWTAIKDPGAKFENLVAAQLLKYCHFLEDTEGFSMQLQFIRDRDGREVDFVVLRDDVPEFAVECKVSDSDISPHCRYFRERTPIVKFYQVHLGSKNYGDANRHVRVIPFEQFAAELMFP